jgi:uncharacterized RDD family membrane protein YckC
MKCPSCGYNSFDHLEYCKKCGSPLGGETEPQTAEAGDRGRGKSRPEKESAGPVTGELFLDIPIRDTEPQTRPEARSPGAARRRRTSGSGTEPEAESYELFPVSKDSEAGDRAGERIGNVSRTAQETPPDLEQGLDAPQHDPFAFIENEAGPYEQEPDRPEEWSGRENDVYNLAGFIPRALALAIDIVVVSLIALLAYFAGLFVLYGFDFGSYGFGDIQRPLYMALFLLSSTYFVFLHGYGGMTVGKMALGIKLINRYGEGIGIWDAFIRWIGYYISGAFLCAGFLWSLVDSEGQTWHDKIAGTYVVKD